MAYVPLPNEILDILADDILAACSNQATRLKTGKSVSLVCRSFVGLGRRVLWSSMTVTCSDSTHAAARKLAGRPDLLCHVRELYFKQPQGACASTDIMLDILCGCSTKLKLLECGPATKLGSGAVQGLPFKNRGKLDKLANLTFAPGLQSLAVQVVIGSDLTDANLASALSRFPRLDALHLAVDFGQSLTTGLSPVVEANKLTSVHLDAAARAKTSECSLCMALPRFVRVLVNLKHLKHVRLGTEPPTGSAAVHTTPVGFDVVLSSLPPIVETYKIDGVRFDCMNTPSSVAKAYTRYPMRPAWTLSVRGAPNLFLQLKPHDDRRGVEIRYTMVEMNDTM